MKSYSTPFLQIYYTLVKKAALLIYLLAFQCFNSHIIAQTAIDSSPKNFVNFTGALNITTNTYGNGNIGEPRQSPFSYALTGSPTLSIGNISFPFSFTFSDQKFSYAHPFNRYGVSPTYKWVKLHLGYRSLNFSPYTLAGRQFFGAGVELTLGKFNLSAVSGKLENLLAKRDSIVFGATPVETYKRKLKGLKIGIGQKSGLDLIYLKVIDELASSIPNLGDNTRLLPQDNVVIGLNGRITFFKRLLLKVESAGSLHTNDAREDLSIPDSVNVPKIYERLDGLIKPNLSTRWGLAGNAGLDLNTNPFSLGIGYQRIDPYFKSLGVYYMVTDFESYTAHLSTKLFNKKLRLRLKGGFQKNNLSLVRRSSTIRKVGSVNLSYASKGGFSLNANFNNIQTDQRAGYIEIEDSLRLALVNSSAMLNLGYSWKTKDYRHSINTNLGSTKFKDINDDYFLPIGETKNNNINLNYALRHKPSQMSYRLGINSYRLTSPSNENKGIGLSAGISKKMLAKKLTVRFSGSYNIKTNQGEKDGYFLRLRNKISYKITKKQNLGFYISWARRPSIVRPLKETRAILSYNLRF